VGRAGLVAIGAVSAALVLAPGRGAAGAVLGVLAITVIVLLGSAGLLPVGRRRHWTQVLAWCCGALVVALRLVATPGPTAAVAIPDGSGPWHAVVEGVGAPHDGRQPATLRLDVPDELRVAATLPRLPEIRPGDDVTVAGRLEAPSDDAYGDYLRRIGVTATIFSRNLEIAPRSASMDLDAVRRQASDALALAIPEPEAGLAAGIVIGLRDRVDRDLAAAFTTAGASHVVAISGWNIAIVAAAVGALGGRLARRRRSILTVIAIATYVAFVGASPSVLRAAAMAGVVLLARESGRAGRASAALSWAAVLILAMDPSLVRDPGFQLSTLATAGLLAWSAPIGVVLTRIGGGRLPGWLVESLAVSFAAQAATTPVVLASFGRLSLVAPLVGLIVVPLVAPAMAAAGIALVAGLAVSAGVLPAAAATLGGLPAWALLAGIVAAVRAGAALPFASVTLQPPQGAIAASVAGLSIALLGWRTLRQRLVRVTSSALVGTPRRRKVPPSAPSRQASRKRRLSFTPLEKAAAVALAAAIVGAGTVILHRSDGRTRIVVLDVGQGDAILIEGSRGSRMLIDGGPDPDRLLVTLDERFPPWGRRLDALVLTHPHEDHVAGLALLLARYRVTRVYEPGMRGPGPGYAAWAEGLRREGIAIAHLSTGDRLALDDARLTVLWPDEGAVPAQPPDTGTGINNVSIVFLGEAAGHRFLLAGDIEQEIDPILLARGLPRVDVLKVAHHGSRTSSTDPFLDAVRPSIAVASAGVGNPYGHPAPGTIARIKAHGARVLRTDQDGTVEVTLNPERVSVATSGPRRTAPTTAGLPLGSSARIPKSTELALACGIRRAPAPGGPTTGTPVADTRIPVPDGRSGRWAPPRGLEPPPGDGPDPLLLYDRVDVGPRAGGSGRPAVVRRSITRAREALARGRRGRRLPGRADRGLWRGHRSPARRVGRAPP
jgi:competence protein ComEC